MDLKDLKDATTPSPQRVVLVDVDIPLGSLFVLIVKLWIVTIPVVVLLWIVSAILVEATD